MVRPQMKESGLLTLAEALAADLALAKQTASALIVRGLIARVRSLEEPEATDQLQAFMECLKTPNQTTKHGGESNEGQQV
jgi:hypothetical protein